MVECTGFENRRAERYREFESPPLRTWYTKGMENIKIEHHTVSGGLWVIAWMFTIGYLHLSFWSGVLAIVIWPYYLGASFAGM